MSATYPLQWPIGRPRSPRRRAAQFQTSGPAALSHLANEVRLLGGKSLEVTTNLPVQKHRLEPRWSDKAPVDPAVAVYFTLQGEEVCFACDRWTTVADNIRAIGKTIEALRGIERWGTEDMMRAAFAGYAALPAGDLPAAPAPLHAPTPADPWWVVLGVRQDISRSELDREYRSWVRIHHPDKGGDAARFREVTDAYRAATQEVRA